MGELQGLLSPGCFYHRGLIRLYLFLLLLGTRLERGKCGSLWLCSLHSAASTFSLIDSSSVLVVSKGNLKSIPRQRMTLATKYQVSLEIRASVILLLSNVLVWDILYFQALRTIYNYVSVRYVYVLNFLESSFTIWTWHHISFFRVVVYFLRGTISPIIVKQLSLFAFTLRMV